jgi:aminoglycoside phosphotransferase (APT) family kinase protein
MDDALARYLAPRLGASGEVRIENLVRIPGGASRETWRFEAVWSTNGTESKAPFIVRKDPPGSLLETERDLEYAFYEACQGSEVPVPRMRWLEQDPSHLGSPFFIMERITLGEAAPRVLVSPDYVPVHAPIGRRMYEILGALHRLDWSASRVPSVVDVPAPDAAWKRELDHWERVINENETSPQPIMRAAIRLLRREPPPPAQRISIVHGDYRVGNFLYDREGTIHGLLDWEMAHLGDPIEDLAGSFKEDWEWAGDGRKGGIIDADEAIAVYEAASGLHVDPVALRWWTIFGSVKAQGIWITGAKQFAEGKSQDLMHAMVAWSLINRQDEILLRTLGRLP